MLDPADRPDYFDRQAYLLGQIKAAGDTTPEYNLTGLLYVSQQHDGEPWGLLSVPNALVRGVFDAMTEPGVELPLNSDGKLDAHISVFRGSDIALLGGPDALKNDRGKPFTYSLGRLVSVKPAGWKDVAVCYMLTVHSPQLQALRRSYGLSGLPNDGKYPFHISIGIRRAKVLGRNATAKNTAAA